MFSYSFIADVDLIYRFVRLPPPLILVTMSDIAKILLKVALNTKNSCVESEICARIIIGL
jgi:hypothetical protein